MISFAIVYAGAAFAPKITVTGVFGSFPALDFKIFMNIPRVRSSAGAYTHANALPECQK